MSRRVYYVGVGWDTIINSIQPSAIDRILDPLGDWIRLNDRTWLCSTKQSSEHLYNCIHNALPVLNRIVVLAVDPTERFGLAPPWLWQWLESQQQDQPLDAARIIANVQAAYTAIGIPGAGGPVPDIQTRKPH
jgi:hypothetical protein